MWAATLERGKVNAMVGRGEDYQSKQHKEGVTVACQALQAEVRHLVRI